MIFVGKFPSLCKGWNFKKIMVRITLRKYTDLVMRKCHITWFFKINHLWLATSSSIDWLHPTFLNQLPKGVSLGWAEACLSLCSAHLLF